MQGQRLSNSNLDLSSLILNQHPEQHASSQQRSFSSSAFVLGILENLYASDGDKNHLPPVFQELEKSVGEKKHSLKNAFLNIDPKESQALQEKVGQGIFEALLSISQESDPQLFAEAVLNIGKSLKKKLDEARAGLIFQMLGQEAIPAKVREEAKAEYDAMVGQGATGLRVEHLGNRFFKDAIDYKTIVPMLGSSALFGLVSNAAAARLAGSGIKAISQGLGLKFASSLIGSAVEIPTFALSGRALHQLAGDQVRENVSDDLLSSGITLTLLKGFGFAGNKAFAQLHQLNEVGMATRLAGLSKFTQPLLSQSFMFAGLLTGHKAEEKAGLRAHVDNATTITDTLASMVSMGVGGHLGHQVLGSGYAKFQQEMEIRKRSTEQGLGSEAPQSKKGTWRQLASDLGWATFSYLMDSANGNLASGMGLSFGEGRSFRDWAQRGRKIWDGSVGQRPWNAAEMGSAGGSKSRLESISPSSNGKDLQLVREEENGAWKIEGLEESRAETKDLLKQANEECRELRERLKLLQGGAPTELLSRWERGIGRLEKRRVFWESEIRSSEARSHLDQGRHVQDISIGIRILLGKMSRLGAELHSYPLPEEVPPEVGLRNPRPVRILTPGISLSDIYQGLKNYDVGFGETLAFRPHQIEALKQIEGWLKRHRRKFESTHDLSAEQQELMQGIVVMPVGGGKTRTMMGAFALAMEQGMFRPGKDKFLILNHTEEIHSQNLEVAKSLGEYFQKKFGRPLKVSPYKAEERDLSGDVVVISIPTVAGAERRERLTHDLLRALGTDGKISVAAVDEVHHLGLGIKTGKETWPELMAALRKVSSNFYRLGFTATPTGHEGALLSRVSAMELMKAGVTPRTYLVKVPGIDLTDVAIRGGEFAPSELERTLLSEENRRKRNIPLFQALEKHGIRRGQTSPSGKEALMPVLGFGADLKHAKSLLEDYSHYFGEGEGGLRERRFITLGLSKGKISEQEIEAAVQRYERGEVDGVLALVSGDTKTRKQLFNEAKAGRIEAVFSVDALVEGSDLYMFTHQLGARATFSSIKKGQERGRINRRGPDELTNDGVIASDPPKILFDVIDEYHRHGPPLMPYGLVMGIPGHTEMAPGELYDLLSGQTVGQVDVMGRTGTQPDQAPLQGFVPRPSSTASKPAATRKPVDYSVDWSPLVKRLHEILEKDYGRDIEELAWDLGETSHFVSQLLEGNGFQERFWFLRRLSTLLYRENREEFVELYNQTKGKAYEQVTTADYELLNGALQFVEKWEGKILDDGLRFQGDFPWGKEEVHIKSGCFQDLQFRRLGEIQWRSLWLGLSKYFQIKPTEEAAGIHQWMMGHLFKKNGWALAYDSKQDQLLRMVRERVAQRFGGLLPRDPEIEGVAHQNKRALLERWLNGEKIEYGNAATAPRLYDQIRALLKSCGMVDLEIEEKFEEAIFEEQGWEQEAKTAREELLLTARKIIAKRFGGVLPSATGLEGVPVQNEAATLNRWINGENVKCSPLFYDQVRALFKGLGLDESEINSKIEAAIFEEQGWKGEAVTAQDELLLLFRKHIARVFGGALPKNTGIEGIAFQTKYAPLRLWLRGEKKNYTATNAPQYFYGQVRTLLNGMGVLENIVKEKVNAAIFEERGWKQKAETAQDKLLLLVRQEVAQRFGGLLPGDTGIEGVSWQTKKTPLARWLSGEKIKYSGANSPKYFYDQIRVLLKGLGVSLKEIESNIEGTIFEEQGWPLKAENPQEELLLLVRTKVAKHFGGTLSFATGIEGVSWQSNKGALTRWINGEKKDFDKNLFSQIRALLTHEGFKTPEEVEALIAKAL
jgi:superfamily II DNA or RNA helicase